jgi:phage-related tail protein
MNVPVTSIETIEPPSHNDKMRETIKQVVEQMATDVRKNLDALRKEIDALDALVISNAARVAASLTEHANICGEVQQEIVRLSGVVATMRATQVETTQVNGHG